jgi:hypothetical protein
MRFTPLARACLEITPLRACRTSIVGTHHYHELGRSHECIFACITSIGLVALLCERAPWHMNYIAAVRYIIYCIWLGSVNARRMCKSCSSNQRDLLDAQSARTATSIPVLFSSWSLCLPRTFFVSSPTSRQFALSANSRSRTVLGRCTGVSVGSAVPSTPAGYAAEKPRVVGMVFSSGEARSCVAESESDGRKGWLRLDKMMGRLGRPVGNCGMSFR